MSSVCLNNWRNFNIFLLSLRWLIIIRPNFFFIKNYVYKTFNMLPLALALTSVKGQESTYRMFICISCQAFHSYVYVKSYELYCTVPPYLSMHSDGQPVIGSSPHLTNQLFNSLIFNTTQTRPWYLKKTFEWFENKSDYFKVKNDGQSDFYA